MSALRESEAAFLSYHLRRIGIKGMQLGRRLQTGAQMKGMNESMRFHRLAKAVCAAAAALVLCCSLTGCLVAGYSSGGGFWVWPGSIVLTVVLLLFFLLRRGR